MQTHGPLIVLGTGFVGEEVARQALAAGRNVIVTTRSEARKPALQQALPGARVLSPDAAMQDLTDAALVVTYPADPDSDARFSAAAADASAVVYVSSTAVYGDTSGVIDDTTPVAATSERARRRLAAEQTWRAVGAVVLRAPGIYGATRGVHVRLRNGSYRLPGDGERHVSRIHVQDLAACCLAALQRGRRGAAHVVGDLEPTTHRELVQFLCEALSLPFPETKPLSEVHETLRGDRQVDPRPALAALGVTLTHPTYRDYLS